jgi:hypothetical protein
MDLGQGVSSQQSVYRTSEEPIATLASKGVFMFPSSPCRKDKQSFIFTGKENAAIQKLHGLEKDSRIKATMFVQNWWTWPEMVPRGKKSGEETPAVRTTTSLCPLFLRNHS